MIYSETISYYICFMIVDDNKNIIIKHPMDFNLLDVTMKNYIFEKLSLGLLLFYIPDKFNESDKLILNSYKIGFLDELLKVMYGEEKMIGKDRYKIIYEKYHMLYTQRSFSSFIKNYKEGLCI